MIFHCNTPYEERLKIYLGKNPTRFLVWKNEYYYSECEKVFDTFEEALTYLGFETEEEYLKNLENTKNEIRKRDGGFERGGYSYYEIKKIDLIEWLEKTIESTVKNTISKEAEEITKVSEARIYHEAQRIVQKYKTKLLKLINEVDTYDE